MNATELSLESLTVTVVEEIHVRASIETTFAALLEELGPSNVTGEGQSMNMKLEAWPGGRWYRDLGNGNGHFWGNVQAIKRPSLLELSGPLFMSYPVASNTQYRLFEEEGGTLIKFRYSALGTISDEHRSGLGDGWANVHARVRTRAEAAGK